MKSISVLSLTDFLHPHQWQIVQQAAIIAAKFDLRLFAVGGIVRDALLNNINSGNIPVRKQSKITDIDLVADGAPKAGIIIATELHKYYQNNQDRNQDCQQIKLLVHDKFQTAELHFSTGLISANLTTDYINCSSEQSSITKPIDWDFTVDLATARQEVYAYEGANPEVQNTTIERDLYRRDFTVNALAVQILPSGEPTPIIDQFNGLADLQNGLLRPIRQGSFAEDPRRIYRAIRFAVRLNLVPVSAMVEEIKQTIATGHFDNLGGSRLRAEIIYNLQEKPIGKSAKIWQQLAELGALCCIHPDLNLPAKFSQNLRLLHWLMGRISIIYHSIKSSKSASKSAADNFAEMGLTLLCSYLPQDALAQLNLPLHHEQKNIYASMQKYQLIQANLEDYLLTNQLTDLCQIKPSFIYEQLCYCHEWELMLWFCRGAKPMRRVIWLYLSRWQFVKSPLNGKDLQRLGYPSGKELGKVIAQLRNLYLDQMIDSPESARLWLATHQPPNDEIGGEVN